MADIMRLILVSFLTFRHNSHSYKFTSGKLARRHSSNVDRGCSLEFGCYDELAKTSYRRNSSRVRWARFVYFAKSTFSRLVIITYIYHTHFSTPTGGRCSFGSGWIATTATGWYVHIIIVDLGMLHANFENTNMSRLTFYFILLRHLMLEVEVWTLVRQVIVKRKKFSSLTIIRGILFKTSIFATFQVYSDSHLQDMFQLYLV